MTPGQRAAGEAAGCVWEHGPTTFRLAGGGRVIGRRFTFGAGGDVHAELDAIEQAVDADPAVELLLVTRQHQAGEQAFSLKVRDVPMSAGAVLEMEAAGLMDGRREMSSAENRRAAVREVQEGVRLLPAR